MKFLLAILCCLAATVCAALGQGVAVELVLDQEQYLPGETLPVKVRISNFSGQNLQLGKDEGWLRFSVEDTRRSPVVKLGTVPVTGEFTLEPTMTGTKRVDVAPHFDITRTGRYFISGTVHVPQWGQAFQTKAITFDIISGSSIWEHEFGVPGTSSDPGSMPEIRRFALVQTLHSKTVKLYFRLTDSRERHVFRVYLLGQMVSFGRPEPQLDRFGNLHVLYQNGGRSFSHCVINPDGVLLLRETHEYSDSRPALRSENDGRIAVVGGVRRLMPSDLPPPVSSTTPANARPDQP